MFLAQVEMPEFNRERKWIGWSRETLIIDAKLRRDAIRHLAKSLPFKDEKMVEELKKFKGHEDGKCYLVKLHNLKPELKANKKVVFISKNSFNYPYSEIRL